MGSWAIDSRTRLVCLIGDPVSGSISPQIHNSAYREMGLNAVYLAFRVERGELEDAVKGLRVMATGFNVTIPHKVAVIGFLDEIDDIARRAGAVNTVINRDGRLEGYNTDVDGVIAPLRGVRGDRALVLGAGGAARAAIVALDELGFREVFVANRTPKRAERLAGEVEVECKLKPMKLEEAKVLLPAVDLLVNATPVGSDGIGKPIEGEFSPELTVFDFVYRPIETPLLREAKLAGCRVVYGYEMLVEQAAKGIELIFGIKPPKTLMYEVARRVLNEG